LLKKAIALYTGGKDSHYAIIKALENGVKVVALVTAIPRINNSWMFHSINLSYTKLHAEAMNLPLYTVYVSGIKEKEVDELRDFIKDVVLSKYEVDFVISGAISSRYQKSRIDSLAEELGLRHYAPLWGREAVDLLIEEVNRLSFIIVATQAYGLTEYWLGRLITPKNLDSFLNTCRKYFVNPAGEGGEIETFVISSPLFNGHAVAIHRSEIKWFPNMFRGYYIIRDASLT